MADRILFYEAAGHKWYADLDLGDGHYLEWAWKDGRRVAAFVYHKVSAAGEGYCPGSIAFEEGFFGRSVWTVESWEPLTLSPSLLCHCGDHGWVRDGRWVRA